MADSALSGYCTPTFSSSKSTSLLDDEICTENSAKKSSLFSGLSTPILCPRHTEPLFPDSLPTAYGKRQRDLEDNECRKRFKEDKSSPKLCVELFKREQKVLFPCYLDSEVMKSGVFAWGEEDKSDWEAEESDEETVVQSQGVLSSQLEKSLQEEMDP